jgi:hypothetical protein
MAASLENLSCYRDEVELFVESIVTGDEMWIYEFIPVRESFPPETTISSGK